MSVCIPGCTETRPHTHGTGGLMVFEEGALTVEVDRLTRERDAARNEAVVRQTAIVNLHDVIRERDATIDALRALLRELEPYLLILDAPEDVIDHLRARLKAALEE